ncbi:NADAR family protein [Glycomyces dulcitolivorans]|uniref:NADAR family protein n=1 Tax=Glycomyces dulcitolivorans TaxID=2200759 RepID=UPI000DD40947|nr:NADAR family protein [Glycomyces dulcitolivorans]
MSVKYLYFWNEKAGADGLGRGCLSQWWPSRFAEDGHRYATAEHYMMAHKAWLFGDGETAERILEAGHPAQVKKLGRQARGFKPEVWEAERLGIVVRGNVLKFGQNPDLREFLLGTGDRVLVEASPVDRIWGIGLAGDDPRAANPGTWRGLNLLGQALMEARAQLRA